MSPFMYLCSKRMPGERSRTAISRANAYTVLETHPIGGLYNMCQSASLLPLVMFTSCVDIARL